MGVKDGGVFGGVVGGLVGGLVGDLVGGVFAGGLVGGLVGLAGAEKNGGKGIGAKGGFWGTRFSNKLGVKAGDPVLIFPIWSIDWAVLRVKTFEASSNTTGSALNIA
mmetsp:Transcript_23765/g.27051  ORF Transcript_23765/g.27051 Transcript_23765/m.27051 type:complete len:107 (-) Transcript_23765:183-503(-)